MAIVNNSPMLAVPGCDDNAILPNEPMVVKALKTTARGVDVSRTPLTEFSSRCLNTR